VKEILKPRVKRAGFVFERDKHPDQRTEYLLSPQSSRMSASDLGVFGLVTVDSMEVFRHFAFWRHGTRLASFLIESENCIV